MPDDEATLRYTTAKGYIQSCKMIALSEHYQGPNIVATVLPLHMLAAFALELYLKAWLLKSGCSSDSVIKYRHNIKNFYDDAKLNGLPTIDQLEEMKNHFAGPHSDFTYRYVKPGGEIKNTNWPLAFKVFDDLDREVDSFLGASVSQGLQPGH